MNSRLSQGFKGKGRLWMWGYILNSFLVNQRVYQYFLIKNYVASLQEYTTQHITASTIIILPRQITSILKVTKPLTMTYTILSKTLVLDIFTQYWSMSNRKLQFRALITVLKNLSIATKETISLSLICQYLSTISASKLV